MSETTNPRMPARAPDVRTTRNAAADLYPDWQALPR